MSGWSALNVTQHRRTCTTAGCARQENQNHNFDRADGFVCSDNAFRRAHLWSCSVCNRITSGNYWCVFNAANICVGGNSTGHTVMGDIGNILSLNPKPGVGCGIHFNR